MKEVKLTFDLKDTKICATIEGYSGTLVEEQILDYLRLLDVKECLQNVTNKDDIEQLTEMAQRIEKRIKRPYSYMDYHGGSVI